MVLGFKRVGKETVSKKFEGKELRLTNRELRLIKRILRIELKIKKAEKRGDTKEEIEEEALLLKTLIKLFYFEMYKFRIQRLEAKTSPEVKAILDEQKSQIEKELKTLIREIQRSYRLEAGV